MLTLTRETGSVRDETREPFDRHLSDLFDRALNELLRREMSRLSFLGTDDREVLRRHLADFVVRGGRRLRPAFVYWGHRASGGSPDDLGAVLAAGCSIELLHACALILDDVMDESPLRRGRTTAHLALAERHRELGWAGSPRRFGESAAILLGVLAFTWADSALLADRRRLADALEVFTQLRVELIAGQYLDLTCAARGGGDHREALLISTYKSGKYTVERPLHLGHAIAGGEPGLRRVLSAYALPLGEAFQLRDDVLGVFGDPARTGKPAGADLLQGKRTYLLTLARERADGPGAALLDALPGTGEARPDHLAAAREVIVATGALEAVERRIRGLTDSAGEALSGADMPADARAALLGLARRLAQPGPAASPDQADRAASSGPAPLAGPASQPGPAALAGSAEPAAGGAG
ncbi:polyprenyl synthetase family protein [Microbispora sp. NBRC 16548]|uniref:polyprenyl synthetase family protein n=1 Tax=Microbispora sp. NBRC 16548 TaxID=3030994 RepID=UPI0024A5D5AE|nr:polyprenyl synthetase family protein [Microbispora sp. NBRC 16548]GLX09147.1 geranylgeranyl pyrophosphate synthase [Microbispora sp. NBRC 16548]